MAMPDYGQQAQGMGSIGAAAQQLAGLYGQGVTGAVVVPTLSRAISRLNELNKALSDINGRAQSLAQAIGGPYPCADPNAKCSGVSPTPNSAMQTLNDEIDAAHSRVVDLTQSIAAMQRALGS